MTPADFAREVVIPTVAEFRADRLSQRRAYLAAIVTFQLVDHLQRAGAVDVATTMRAAVPDLGFDVVRAVCNGVKHVATDRRHAVAFTAGADYARPPAMAGAMQAGLSMCGDFTGGREIPHDGRRIDLYSVVQATLCAFLAAFPGHLTDCPFDPYPDGR